MIHIFYKDSNSTDLLLQYMEHAQDSQFKLNLKKGESLPIVLQIYKIMLYMFTRPNIWPTLRHDIGIHPEFSHLPII